jgi:hypothetical protein
VTAPRGLGRWHGSRQASRGLFGWAVDGRVSVGTEELTSGRVRSGSVQSGQSTPISSGNLASRFLWRVGVSAGLGVEHGKGEKIPGTLDFAGLCRRAAETLRRHRRQARHGCRACRRARRRGSILCWGCSDSGTLSTKYRRAIHSTSGVHPTQITFAALRGRSLVPRGEPAPGPQSDLWSRLASGTEVATQGGAWR